MANKDLTITLKTKNAFSNGFSELGKGVKGVSEKMKGLFDVAAKPILVLSAGVMAIKKGFDVVEEAVRGAGRAFREMRTESLAKSLDLLSYAISSVTNNFKESQDVFASQNRVYDEQTKRVRLNEDAQMSLEKAKKLATATTDEERQAIEDEYSVIAISTKSKREQADLEREVANAKEQSSKKAIEANELQAKSEELAQTALENRTRAVEMGKKINSLNQGVSFLGVASGVNQKEIDSLEKARKAASELADKAVEEQERTDAMITKLRLDSAEGARIASEKELTIESSRIEAQASLLDIEAKQNEKRVKLEEEKQKKLEDLAQKEADIVSDKNQELDEINKRRFQDEKDAAEKIAGLTVKEFLDQKKQDEIKQKGDPEEIKRFKRLTQLSSTGAKLSKKDQEFMKAFGEIQGAKGQLANAQDNLKKIEETKQAKTLKSIETLLKNNLDEQRKLSTAG